MAVLIFAVKLALCLGSFALAFAACLSIADFLAGRYR